MIKKRFYTLAVLLTESQSFKSLPPKSEATFDNAKPFKIMKIMKGALYFTWKALFVLKIFLARKQ